MPFTEPTALSGHCWYDEVGSRQQHHTVWIESRAPGLLWVTRWKANVT